MQIKVNGKITEVSDGCSLKEYLADNNFAPDKVLAAVNDEIIQPQNYDIILPENAKLDLMTFVPGG